MTTAAAVEAVWRLESARIVAGVARLVRDVGLAEEIAQDALVQALEQWPAAGVPTNPGAWLMLAARHRAIDVLRRQDRLSAKVAELGRGVADDQRAALHSDPASDADGGLDDDVLRLIFVACHPALPVESRVALTLRTVGGLTTPELSRAFLTSEATVAQRIVRAKRTIAERHIPFAVPEPHERADRLASVLGVVYLIFNEGYGATAGDDLLRPDLCHEGLRLGRLLAGLAPAEAEVHGLVALMEVQASRLRTRVDAAGDAVPLDEQDRGRWDQLLIRRGFAALLRAQALHQPVGPYVLQAAIACCHARARTAAETDWPQIAALYDNLARLTPTPVVALNRAVAIGYAYGPQAGLDLIEALSTERAMSSYHLLAAARGELLARLGRGDEARASFARAAELTRNGREREALLRRSATTSPG